MSTKSQISFGKKWRRLIRFILTEVLPRPLAHGLIRNTLRLKLEPSPRLTFKVAITASELRATFRLLHQNYVREGYAVPSPSGLRITPYHFLPLSTVIIVKDGEKVIATISIIPRTEFGLPIEGVFDVSDLVRRLPKAIEVSALAVDKNHAGDYGEILFPLMKFVYHCNIDLFAAQMELIGVNPRMVPLYEAILLFQRVPGGETREYEFANGAPVVPLHFDLVTAMEQFTPIYGGKPSHLNLMEFFLAPSPSNFLRPTKERHAQELPQGDPNQLRELMEMDIAVLKSMTSQQWNVLRSLYQMNPEAQSVIDELRSKHAI